MWLFGSRRIHQARPFVHGWSRALGGSAVSVLRGNRRRISREQRRRSRRRNHSKSLPRSRRGEEAPREQRGDVSYWPHLRLPLVLQPTLATHGRWEMTSGVQRYSTGYCRFVWNEICSYRIINYSV
ncbi:hypothetical protein L596_027803 [Steinernema carpocapsae]|uniref:Uncharacterized protein n=1 Tax=Steinernema carpocapsae TaxID=34508 RepID=A0A4U5LWK6_STECR|nr:hypothetical protein L596_027803 [Steinernema carpocapsae]